ncbi:GGDEF domain-containing protein [Botrimarina hoheduenensis]|uniref:diguanylate cyclase n=1 Tax=Botrimarina hoheduenensis TaxID=2528000 RepID=A0A5C5VXW2_9BACT|nr:diguanylate cyclase [Botrimarina hoheduenensis]TWT42835.1 Response regulator PleD [Botrimarina hoheduenensis]
MELLANSHTSLALVNLVFAVVALGVGFAAGAWVFGKQGNLAKPDAPTAEPENDAAEKQLELERTMLASDRLRDLAQGVASDVDAHSISIGKIEAAMSAARDSGSASEADVLQAIESISLANGALQQKLAAAEAQIKTQAEQIRTHESEARTDSLTNLANRRAFDDELTRRFSEWRRKGTSFSLLIMDVDHFKKFNDTHGHQAGDEVLRKVGAALRECCRDMDIPCRYGGEEFAVVMPSTTAADGTVLAERVRNYVEAMQVPFEGKMLRVTMSLGLAQANAADDPTGLIRRADAALYAAKAAGRNNTHLHDGQVSVPLQALPKKAENPAEFDQDATPTVVLDALPNRTKFLEDLRLEVKNACENRAPLTLLTAELEGYSTLVEEFGPAVAKLTLDSVAQFLDSALRERDRLSRLSEAQFVVLMPLTTTEEARAMGDRIAAALAECSVPLGDRSLRLMTRTGVTSKTPHDTAVTLMQRAEESLGVALKKRSLAEV